MLVFLLLGVCGCSTKGVQHVVLPGQTMYRISKTYGVPVEDIARRNSIRNISQIKAGDTLWIPGVEHKKTVSITPLPSSSKPAPAKPKVASTRTAPNPTKSIPPAKSKPVAKTSPPAKAKPPVNRTHKEAFDWPVKGQIIKDFKAGNKNGIEIAVPAGTAVFSAAAGQVIYSSNDIAGYGSLIIIKHNNEVYTVYGYNKKSLVQAGGFVGRKEKIAISGVPPGGQQGRLHFEVREGKTDVNPMLYLQ
ncbi:MAG: M23 family metallopeptidase [Desulfuromonadaceae bacterium]|nr:M23 family metallopeptidase [Desulfuromonadaceae bacterium]